MFGFGKKKKFEPLVVENELGKFTMRYNKKEPLYYYQGEVTWSNPDDHIYAYVNCDSKESFSADRGFAKLAEVLANSAAWDARLREYALDFGVSDYGLDDGTIEIWGSWDPNSDDYEADPVTQDEFAKRISVASVTVEENGDLQFDIDLDDMFTDHCLTVLEDKDGNLTDSGLQG